MVQDALLEGGLPDSCSGPPPAVVEVELGSPP
jgi:hypothetical protein